MHEKSIMKNILYIRFQLIQQLFVFTVHNDKTFYSTDQFFIALKQVIFKIKLLSYKVMYHFMYHFMYQQEAVGSLYSCAS